MSFYNWDMLPISPDRPGIVHRRIFGDEIQIQHLISEPGGTTPELHNHPDHEEILYVQAGEWECTLGNEIRKIAPGDVVHVKKGQMHTLELKSNEPGMVLEIFHPILNTELAKDKENFTIEAIRDRMEFHEEPDEMNRGRPPKFS